MGGLLNRQMIKRLLLILLSVAAAASVCTAQGSFTIYWDESPGCIGSVPAETGALQCENAHGRPNPRSLRHGDLRLTVTYWWFPNVVKVSVQVENNGDNSIPVAIDLWGMKGYKSIEDFKAGAEPIDAGRARDPYRTFSMGDIPAQGPTSGLPSNAPVSREVTTRQTTNPSTGQIINPNTKVINPDSGISPSVVLTEAKAGPSALKWKGIAARTRQVGEVSFWTERKVKFALLTFNINNISYVYKIGPRR